MSYLEQNVAAADVELTGDEIAGLDDVFPLGAAAGTRYSEAGMRAVNL